MLCSGFQRDFDFPKIKGQGGFDHTPTLFRNLALLLQVYARGEIPSEWGNELLGRGLGQRFVLTDTFSSLLTC